MATDEQVDDGLRSLFRSLPQTGTIEYIGVRPGKGEKMKVLEAVNATAEGGLEGDRFDGGRTRQRQITLIQKEHIEVVASILQKESIDPNLTRRQIVVSGINLQSLKKTRFQIGNAVFEGTCDCPPCSQMERNLGKGGYNAMRGHGGICAKVIEDGEIKVGDSVKFIELVESKSKS